MAAQPQAGANLFRLYQQVSMETAMQLEEEFSDSELGLVAQSTTDHGYDAI